MLGPTQFETTINVQKEKLLPKGQRGDMVKWCHDLLFEESCVPILYVNIVVIPIHCLISF